MPAYAPIPNRITIISTMSIVFLVLLTGASLPSFDAKLIIPLFNDLIIILTIFIVALNHENYVTSWILSLLFRIKGDLIGKLWMFK